MVNLFKADFRKDFMEFHAKLLTPPKKIGQTVRNRFLGPVINFPGVGFYDLISFNILEGMRDRIQNSK